MSRKQAMYPVVILRAGGGALSSDFTSLAEDLASHGYIVVSFDAPYRTVITAFPDGRVATRTAGGDFDAMPSATAQRLATQVMSVWIADLKFVLDQLRELNAHDPTGDSRVGSTCSRWVSLGTLLAVQRPRNSVMTIHGAKRESISMACPLET